MDLLRTGWSATLVVFTMTPGGERFSDNWPWWAARWTRPKAASVCLDCPWPADCPTTAPARKPADHGLGATMLDAAGAHGCRHPLDGARSCLLRDATWHDNQPLFWRIRTSQARAMRHSP